MNKPVKLRDDWDSRPRPESLGPRADADPNDVVDDVAWEGAHWARTDSDMALKGAYWARSGGDWRPVLATVVLVLLCLGTLMLTLVLQFGWDGLLERLGY